MTSESMSLFFSDEKMETGAGGRGFDKEEGEIWNEEEDGAFAGDGGEVITTHLKIVKE